MDCHGVTDNESLCRLCLEPCTVYYSIFENNATEMLEALTSIRVESGDVFTTLICSGCLSDLTNAYTIQQKIIENQKHLAKSVCIKKEAIEHIPESIFHEENEFNPPEIMKREIKMEVNISEDPLRMDTNLIAETDYGLIEDDGSDIEDSPNLTVNSVIPDKSKQRYEVAYKKFEDWCQQKNVDIIDEKVMLAYFDNIKTLKSSTLWTTYSMLNATLKVKKNIDIRKYATLIALLKRKSAGYLPKKSRILSRENIEKFLREADDKQFLFTKVAMIIGIAGACRKSELTFLRVQDVVYETSYFRITLPQTKTDEMREFVVTTGDIPGINLINFIQQYINLRPPNTKHDRFFVNYRNEKCGPQPVGINTFGKLPQKIAEYLGLQHASEYTGHCFRRSSASLLGGSGTNVLKIKRHGGW